MSQNKFPPNWDEERVQRVLAHYEGQADDEAVIEDETILSDQSQAWIEVPMELVPAVRELIAKYYRDGKAAA